MPNIRYTGFADVRSIDAAAFKRVGVEDQHKAVWDASNGFVTEVSEEAAEYLRSTSEFEDAGDDTVEMDAETGDNDEKSSTRTKKGKRKDS